MTITQEYLKSILLYDKLTGDFTWASCIGGSSSIGAIAGRLSHGYIGIQIKEKKYQAHRLAWLYINGELPKKQIDHINHNRSDNRISNLRTVTLKENQRNRSINKNNTSGVCGVTRLSNGGWQAQIGINGVTRYLGSFKSKVDAIKAREDANKENSFHKNHGVLKQ